MLFGAVHASASGTKRTCQSLQQCPLSGVRRTLIDITGVFGFAHLLPHAYPLAELPPPLVRLAMTFPAQHDAIKQRRIRSAPMMKFERVPSATPKQTSTVARLTNNDRASPLPAAVVHPNTRAG
jgi:hypothetical protein